ncbi:hypothetical protein FRC17_005929, partial [Serendipita sp. 399]
PYVERSASSWGRSEVVKAYVEEEHKIEAENPTMLYSSIIEKACERVAAQLGITLNDEERKAARESIRTWGPFADTVDALARLSKHYVLIILSNVDLESFSYTRKILEHGFTFNKILTAQEIGSYKPDERNFLYMLKIAKDEFGVEREQVLVTAQSLMHDHVPANKLGLSSAWIARREGHCEAEGVTYTYQFPTLGAMADALEAEAQSSAGS